MQVATFERKLEFDSELKSAPLAEAEAQAYLQQVAQRAFPAGIRVEQHVHTSEVRDVARGLVEHAAELQIWRIIIMPLQLVAKAWIQ